MVDCGHCHRPIEPGDLIVFEDRGPIHVRCWLVDDSKEMRPLTHLIRRSQRLIDESRRRLGRWLHRASLI